MNKQWHGESMNYNKVQIGGNLTRDPELRYTPSNQAVVNIGIAVNRSYVNKQTNEKVEETTFVDCEAWGKTAENIGKYFSKGRPIFIDGRLKLDTWQDQSGGNRSKLKVVVESFQFVGGKDDRPGGERQANSHASRSTTDYDAQPTPDVPDVDIPF